MNHIDMCHIMVRISENLLICDNTMFSAKSRIKNFFFEVDKISISTGVFYTTMEKKMTIYV